MTIKITKATAISAVRQAVKAKGRDHTAVCSYMDGGQPACIVGHALFNLGVEPRVLDRIEGGTIGTAQRTLLHEDVEITLKALDFLDTAQTEQDNGETWGVALDRALGKA